MANQVYQSQKCDLVYSKNEIDRAAQSIRHHCEGEDREHAIAIIQNFREVHLYPLMLMKNHLARTAARISDRIIIARRLKRLPTILDKLERPTLDGVSHNSIKLTRMQDIGGCRAIVKNIDQLLKLKEKLEQSTSVHRIIRINDYLKPKQSGYGGIHLIYSCFEEFKEDNQWKKTKIEVQLRTELQHAWATSLEIIDTLEGIKLKTTTENYEEWRRFFFIAGSLVAHDEKAEILDDNKLKELRIELKHLEERLSVIKKIDKYALVIDITTGDHMKGDYSKLKQGFFLVELSKTDDGRIYGGVRAYKQKQAEIAVQDLNESEKNNYSFLSALVSVGDVKNLKKAYPNYFGSTKKFTNFLEKHIAKIQA